MLLEGKVGYVIGNFRRLLKQHRLIGNKRKTLSAVITYYENNRDQMKYDEYHIQAEQSRLYRQAA